MSGTAREEDHGPFLKFLIDQVLGEQMGKGTAYKRRSDHGPHAFRAEDFRYVNTVHDGGQHADLIGLDPVDLIAGTASPEIAAADDDTDIVACLNQLAHLARDHFYGIQIKSLSFGACQRFSAQFQNDSAHIFILLHVDIPAGSRVLRPDPPGMDRRLLPTVPL